MIKCQNRNADGFFDESAATLKESQRSTVSTMARRSHSLFGQAANGARPSCQKIRTSSKPWGCAPWLADARLMADGLAGIAGCLLSLHNETDVSQVPVVSLGLSGAPTRHRPLLWHWRKQHHRSIPIHSPWTGMGLRLIPCVSSLVMRGLSPQASSRCWLSQGIVENYQQCSPPPRATRKIELFGSLPGYCTAPRASTLTAPSTSVPRTKTTLSKRLLTGQT